MSDQKYNGWENYPTWDIALWINNTQGDQEYVTELVNEQENVYRAAVALKDWVDEMHEELYGNRADMFSDLLSWAIGQTNWVEIAESFWDENLHRECSECGDRLDEDIQGDLCDDCRSLQDEEVDTTEQAENV